MRLNVHTKRGKKGFTLVELLVTIVIIAIIGVFSFAIMMSSLNTFDKQKEVVDAVEVKNLVMDSLRGFLQNKPSVLVTMTNLEETKTAADGTILPLTPEGEITMDLTDPSKAYIVDKKLVDGGMLYSSGGRLYIVEQTILGKYYVDANNMPLDADNKGLFGRKKLLDEYVYKGYDVDVRFMPFFTNIASKYQDLKVIVEVRDPNQNNIVVAYGYQFIHMLNIENAKADIEFRNPNGAVKGPGDTPYSFLYFE